MDSSHTIRTYEGYLVESRLAADLEGRGQQVIWLRPEDHDLKQGSLARMLASIDHPPVSALSDNCTVVIQLAVGTMPGLTSGLPAGREIVLASILDGAGPPDEQTFARLPADRSAATAAADQLGSSIPAKMLDRLVDVASGRAALIDSVLRASRGPAARSALLAIERAHDVPSLVAATTASLLESAEPVRLDALALAARLGYAHDRLSALRPALHAAEREPWWQPLAGGWQRLHYLWGKALLFLPAAMTASGRDRLIRLVGELEAENAHAEAVELCFRAGAWDTAAEVLIDSLDIVLAERADAVGRWLAEFPPAILARHPALSRLRTALALELPPGSPLPQDPWVALHESCVALTEMRFDTARTYARRAGQLGRHSGEAAVRGYAKQIVRLTHDVGRTNAPHKGMDRFLRAVEFAARLDAATHRNMPAGAVQVPAPRRHGDSMQGPSRRVEPDRSLRRPGGGAVRVSGESEMVAYLLGEFRLMLEDQKLTSWSGVLGKSLLKFLMIQRPKPVTRGMLIAAFWPGVPLASAKNRLHVALYGLRTDLRRVCSKPVVIHDRDTYTINPELTVWLDVEEFTRLKAAGTKLARTGSRDEAIRALQAASSLYQGDLMEDTPYAEWAAAERERLATAYVDLLAQLARMYFDDGRYQASVDTCRRLLARDPCWEQAHRLVMRSYLRLDEPHRAMAQFELCKRTLHTRLGMTPDPTTVALYESIRAHRGV
jgi:DNA-binding SARP family transcriptional activator